MKLLAILMASLSAAIAQEYQLQSYFPGATFVDNFDFYTSWDPTYGYVHYVDRATAEQHGMISYTPNTTRWGVESTQVLDPSANLGRLSLRLTSKQSWNHGLFVLDLKHMPHNSCGVWPAWWTVGSGTWPQTGEIDIVEFTNNGPSNLIALHTLPGCSIAGANMTGQLDYNDCNQGGGYTGCAIRSREVHGSGAQFNAIQGGVYAMEWTSRWVRVWFFPRGYVPESIAGEQTNIQPDTSTFGVPVANFEGSCNFDEFLRDHTMIFNVDFCGSYAGNVYGLQGCPMTDPTNAWSSCVQYVALNPSAFSEVYWEVNWMKVYQDNTGWVPPSSALSSVVPAASSGSVSKLSSNAQGRPTTPTMSLAGTTPTVVSFSFSATRSVLSVLSSLSTASEANVSSSPTGLESQPASTSVTTLPFSSSTLPSIPPEPPASQAPSSAMSPATVPPVSTGPAMAGVTFVTVVVPEIVTVFVTPPAQQPGRNKLLAGNDESDTSTTSADIPSPTSTKAQYGECSFDIPRTSTTTNFECTFTKLGLLSGSFYTNRISFTTSIPAETGLSLLTFLTIDTISVQTQLLEGGALGATFTAVVGSLVPTASSVASTMLSAYQIAVGQSTFAASMSTSVSNQ